MKAFFNQFINAQTATSQNEFHAWRERTIGISLLGIFVLATGICGGVLFNAVKNQEWLWGLISTVGYGLIAWIIFSNRVPYRVRAGTSMAILYLLGVFTAVRAGNSGSAGLWLVLFAILSTIFFGRWIGIGTVFLSGLSLLLLGFVLNGTWIKTFSLTLPSDIQNTSIWINSAIVYVGISLVSTLVYGTLLRNLERSLKSRSQIRQELEHDREKFAQRSQEIERRAIQARTAAEISRVLSAELIPEQLFSRVVNLVKERFDLYYVGVFIVDPRGYNAILQAGSGEEGRAMLESGHQLAVNTSSMIGWAISRRQARIALDVGQEAVHFDNPYLPRTRSELALPMNTGTQVLGAMSVQSDLPEAFDEDDIIVLQGVADSLAIAVQNARLFHQAESSLKEVRMLHEQYLGEAWASVSTTQGDLRYTYENPLKITAEDQTSSTLEKPIIIRDNIIGNITLETDKPTWDPEEEAFIEAVASQAAIALENVRLMDSTQKSAQHDRMVTDLSTKAWASTDIETILQTTLRELTQSLQATKGFIILETTGSHQESS